MRAYEVTVLITTVFLLAFFKMLDASQSLKFSLKILLVLSFDLIWLFLQKIKGSTNPGEKR